MPFERTGQGLEARLRPAGIGRYVSAAFLLVWLTGWALGEGFALWMLGAGAAALLTGNPLAGQQDPLLLGPAVFIGLFLLVWLLLWSLGGYMAARELLRSIASEDHFVVRPDGLTVHHRVGPFRSTTSIPRSSLIRVYSIARKHRLMAETVTGTVELTSHPLSSNPEELAEWIRREAGLAGGAPSVATSLPENWSEIRSPEGGISLVRGARHRPTQARVAWAITTVVALLTMPLLERSSIEEESRVPAALLATLAVWSAWGSWRLSTSRLEWKLDAGCIRYRRRFARGIEEIFEGTTLELVESTDSDGDPWFKLNVVAAGPRPFDWRRPLTSWRRRRTIEKEMDDATNVRRLGAFVAAHTGLRLDERRDAA